MGAPDCTEVGGLDVALESYGSDPAAKALAARAAASRLGHSTVGYSLYHTPWGQPRFRRAPSMHSISVGAPHISFSDAGELHVAAACASERCRGVGVDVLSLARFRAACVHGRARQRMMARIIGPAEGADAVSSWDQRIVRLGARFSLKEAVSKALGTGLNLGLGLGARHGVPMPDVRLSLDEGCAVVALTGRAASRARSLGGGSISAVWWIEGDHVYAVAVLLASGRRNLLPAPTVVGV